MKEIYKSIQDVSLEVWVYHLMLLFLLLILFSITYSKSRILSFFIGLALVAGSLMTFKHFIGGPNILSTAVTVIVGCYGLIAWKLKGDERRKDGKGVFVLRTKNGAIKFFNPLRNFLIIAGSGSGKTKSHGKPLLQNYIENGYAGFIYDFKDFDYTKSAYYLVQKNNYPYKFYYLNFRDLTRTYRTNPINPKLLDEDVFEQIMYDVLSSYVEKGEKGDWFGMALGLFKGVAMRFYYDYPQHCNIPVVTNFCMHNDPKRITAFLQGRPESASLANSFIAAESSPKTQGSILATLGLYISSLASNKKICYVLSGNDFDFNLIDPLEPKLIAASNSYQIQKLLGPIIGLMIKSATRHFTMDNKIPTMFFLDEATTFNIDEFETLPSVLREYKCSFTLLTQSIAKIEKQYGKLDKQSLQGNFGNIFYGSISELTDIESFSMLFSKKNERRISHTRGQSGDRGSRSISVTEEEKKRYDASFFQRLTPGEFVGVTREASIPEFHAKFVQYKEPDNIELPLVHNVTDFTINDNYEKIVHLVKSL